MTLTEPSVSTAGRRRTRAWRCAMRRAPRASEMVTTAGRPSGMAATARLTAMRNISSGSSPRSRPVTKTRAQMAMAATASQRPSSPRRRCSGVVWSATLLEELGDAADGRAHAGRHDDAAGAPGGHGRAAEGHVEHVARRGGLHVRQGGGDLGDGLRFTGQGRLVDAQRGRLHETQVGGDDVALLEEEDVARHDIPGGHELRLVVPDDARLRAGHALERIHGLLGPVLLDEADDAVEDDDGQDDGRVLGVADERGDHRCHQEHHDHGARELVQQQAPGRALLRLDELVGPVSRQAFGSVKASEPRRGIDPEQRCDGWSVLTPGLHRGTR